MSSPAPKKQLERIGVAIDEDLLQKFDELIAGRGYSNRSEAFRGLIRAELVGEVAGRPQGIVTGTITLLYDHNVRLLSEKLSMSSALRFSPRCTSTWTTTTVLKSS